MAVLEFAGFVLVLVLAVCMLSGFAIALKEKHADWQYKLEKKKRDDEQIDRQLRDGDK